MKENFDYAKAVSRLEEIAKQVEDPQTGLDEMDKYLAESEELIGKCREYLRTAREKLSAMDQ
ncbi:MAG: exodeoxyribonuclease VII small subunit [Bacteroidales bacterium]|nr:exodeoxyribonuclease VII small subunit [Bacteroidales bacterium]